MVDRKELKQLIGEVLREVLAERDANRIDGDVLIDINEASILLNLAKATLYEKTSEKAIPHYKTGKKILFKKSELVQWIEKGRIQTTSEVSALVIQRIKR